MRDFIGSIRIAFGIAAIALVTGCETIPPPTASPSSQRPVVIADRFAYPLGDGKRLTAPKDAKDDWFNALDFGDENHLGEDWNKNTGGNTDCGEPVYAAGNGSISYAGDAGPGWGNVVIITHSLADGSRLQTLYGHLREILKNIGDVTIREKIGTIGNANGRYLCHLHFELRESSSLMWDKAGAGYSTDRTGWLDPSDFIENHINK